MRLTRLLPSPAEVFELETHGADTLAELYATGAPTWLRINLIASVNGNLAGADGTSEGLTNRTDRRILGAIRRRADLVLVGASSVRKEGYLLPRTAPLAIVTGTGDLSGHRIPSDVEEGRVLVLCPREATTALERSLDGAKATVITLDGPRLAAASILSALRERGYGSIVCEGGPTLATQLLDAGAVDELCLSTSPVIAPTTVPMLQGLVERRRLTLSQLLLDQEGVLYARWAVKNQVGVKNERAARQATA